MLDESSKPTESILLSSPPPMPTLSHIISSYINTLSNHIFLCQHSLAPASPLPRWRPREEEPCLMTCASSLPWKSVCSTWRRTQSGQRVCSPQTEGVKCIGNTLTIGKKCEVSVKCIGDTLPIGTKCKVSINCSGNTLIIGKKCEVSVRCICNTHHRK